MTWKIKVRHYRACPGNRCGNLVGRFRGLVGIINYLCVVLDSLTSKLFALISENAPISILPYESYGCFSD
jgi:hypothetical protein